MNPFNATSPRRAIWMTRPLIALLCCLVALLAGCGSNSSDAPPIATPLSIALQPSDQSAMAGSNASFSVQVGAAGAATSIQWQALTGGAWTNIAGATGSTLTIAGVTHAQDGSQYRAVVTANGVTVVSAQVTLTVTAAPAAPSITVQPADVAITEPATATFNVTAAGSATLAYQWQRQFSGTWTDIAGAGSASYTTPATVRATDHGAQFRVIVTNAVGSRTSEAATLTVNPAPVAPDFTTQPVDVTVTEPATASFTVAVTGTPAPTLQWQFSTDAGTTWNNVTNGTGTTDASYKTAATTTSMSGWRYRALATSGAGATPSTAATLTVNAAIAAPAIVQHPANATVPSATAATFTVSASGSPSPTYQWQRQAPGGGGFFNITGATGASYTTPAAYFLDDGDVTDTGTQYRVVLTNGQGSVTSNAATLTVTPAALVGFTQVSAGANHVLALASNGSVWSWGTNGYGQVGRACTACSPRPVSGLAGSFTQVLARGDTSFAVRSDGTVWAWGYNDHGQLGRNVAAGTNSSTPAQVLRQSDLQPLTAIVGLTMTNAGGSGGDASVLAWTAAGAAWKWGHAAIEPGLSSYPGNMLIAAVPHVYYDASTAARSLSRAAAGGQATVVAIDGTGAAVFWSCNFAGCSFGTTPVTPFSSIGFSGTAIDIAIDGTRVALVRSDNTLWGQAYTTNGFGDVVWNGLNQNLVQLPVPVSVTRATVGRGGAVTLAWGAGGVLYAAGNDVDGQLGDGTAGGSRTSFAAVLTINDGVAAAVGGRTTHALRAAGALWGWGENSLRTNGTTDSANRPIGSSGWIALEASPFSTRGR
ncbi:MAG TPA: hypothetical protein PLE54_05160 [Burkholderiaceae bacterium]|nr:hypothetical protein [Burkholderiaceae bacterium]